MRLIDFSILSLLKNIEEEAIIDCFAKLYQKRYPFLYPDGLFEFTAVTVLNGRQIDSYNSRNRIRTPKQDWLKKLLQRDLQTGTADLQEDGLWPFHLHYQYNVHILQWRFGYATEATFNVLRCINEYGYDGEALIFYDWISIQWKATFKQVQDTAERWNSEHGQNIVLVRCVEWMKIYLNYSNTEISQSEYLVSTVKPRAVSDPGKLTLTCLATSFYPKDVMMSVRKYRTSLPEKLITSSGVRPNDNEGADYDYYVTHSSLTEPAIKNGVNIFVTLKTVFMIVIMAVVATIVLKKKRMIAKIAQVRCC
uniref:MHC class I-like antigen recognition-like domain-containing protein n=1 Tax=Electrophorus electricus TaxID=8005 RepID=A0AAY5F461_ELEEL